MADCRYLVAKYVSDVFRNEPVNIGVLTWIDGKVDWRFLGQKYDGTIDGRAQGVAGRIKSVQNYKQWVDSWIHHLKSEKLQTRNGGEVRIQSPEFMGAMAAYGSGNYVLESGGELANGADPGEIKEVTNYLFDSLVGVTEEKEQYKSADDVRNELLREAEVIMDSRVKMNWPVRLELRGKEFKPEFSIYIGNGAPEVLAHMVPLTAQGRTAQNSARAAELMFLRVLEANILPQEKCIALVYAREDEESSDIVERSKDELSSVATVMDVTRERRSIVNSLSRWVRESPAH
jgi:hypothetical protein